MLWPIVLATETDARVDDVVRSTSAMVPAAASEMMLEMAIVTIASIIVKAPTRAVKNVVRGVVVVIGGSPPWRCAPRPSRPS